ncbi:hypothetical protein GCM10009860_22380 [Microbacterium mitrae]|uniref:Beta-galactosidase n=1 Tax=Microbacterium mitrae TaxID=664640 RepID=A0A5C8HNX7_9MICO|nr:beta-galactosidase family protein [Microbacterium mitrae]TXK04078.1 beta-galactosidase [Microbacterium mitrae]
MTPNSSVETEVTAALTVRDGELLRDGKTHRILSGALHYFRVHPDQWEDRLRRLAAMGANTVDTYVEWNFHERTEGEISFEGWRDLERFITLAGEIGLDVFLRPSPYICAEWSNGGIPHWLSARVHALRTSDPEFLRAVSAWYDELMPRMVPLQAAFGGPIVAIQLENEYGSFGTDRTYLEFLRDDLIARGFVELLTTADGITTDMIENGSVDGVMGTFTFGTGVARAVELKAPEAHLMCSEMWGGWFDHWTEKHHVRSAASMIGTIDELLAAGGSVSLYMAHGGTNFGLWNGANFDGALQPTVTSYDSDAPIGEDGRINAKFLALREAFAPYKVGGRAGAGVRCAGAVRVRVRCVARRGCVAGLGAVRGGTGDGYDDISGPPCGWPARPANIVSAIPCSFGGRCGWRGAQRPSRGGRVARAADERRGRATETKRRGLRGCAR